METKFKVGDKVRITNIGKPSNKDSLNNIGKEFIIKEIVGCDGGFVRNYKDQGISTVGYETGIWLSNLELVIDKSIDLLAEAKRRYPVGTKVKCLKYGDILSVDSYINGCQTYDAFWVASNDQSNPCVFSNGVWAEIVKEELSSLPIKWCIKDSTEVSDYAAKRWQCAASVNHNSFYHEGNTDISRDYTFSHKIENGFTEITFEQFKKWVLKKDKYKTESEFLSKKDLINGEYYNVSDGDTIWIVKYGGKNSFLYNFISYYNGFYHDSSSYKYKKATFSEIQWLKACIKANKFISKEEALRKYNNIPKINNNIFKIPLTISNFNISSFISYKTKKNNKIQNFSDLLSHSNQKNALSYLTDSPKYKGFDLEEYTWPLYKDFGKSNELEFQQPVIIKNNNKRKQLIIINQ